MTEKARLVPSWSDFFRQAKKQQLWNLNPVKGSQSYQIDICVSVFPWPYDPKCTWDPK